MPALLPALLLQRPRASTSAVLRAAGKMREGQFRRRLRSVFHQLQGRTAPVPKNFRRPRRQGSSEICFASESARGRGFSSSGSLQVDFVKMLSV